MYLYDPLRHVLPGYGSMFLTLVDAELVMRTTRVPEVLLAELLRHVV